MTSDTRRDILPDCKYPAIYRNHPLAHLSQQSTLLRDKNYNNIFTGDEVSFLVSLPLGAVITKEGGIVVGKTTEDLVVINFFEEDLYFEPTDVEIIGYTKFISWDGYVFKHG